MPAVRVAASRRSKMGCGQAELVTALCRAGERACVPETALGDHVARVFAKAASSTSTSTAAPPPAAEAASGGEGGGAAAAAGEGGAAAAALAAAAPAEPATPSAKSGGGGESTLPLEEVCARLFAEPLMRASPRTSPQMLEGVVAALQAAAGGGKGKKGKGGGKKGKGAAAPSGVTVGALREAIAKADAGPRASVETDFVAASVFAAARRAQPATSAAGAVAAVPGGSAPASPAKGAAAGGGGAPPAAVGEDEAPFELVLEVLRDSLLQPTPVPK